MSWRNLNIRTKSRQWAVIVIAAIAVFYFLIDPLESRFVPQCVFHRLTGLQCIGCGSQRMLHALLHGDITAAFRANAFVTLSLPFILFLIWLEANRTRHPHAYAKVYSVPLIIGVGAAMAAWFIIRNILGI